MTYTCSLHGTYETPYATDRPIFYPSLTGYFLFSSPSASGLRQIHLCRARPEFHVDHPCGPIQGNQILPESVMREDLKVFYQTERSFTVFE